MVALAAGLIALVPFPFSDLSRRKLRPVLVLADVGRDDWILCQVTSRPFGDEHAVRVELADGESGMLRADSFVRPGKLFTAAAGLVVAILGRLRWECREEVVRQLIDLIRPSAQQPG